MTEKRVEKNVIRKLKEKKEELGKSPSKKDVSNSLLYAARKYFGSWNRAKEKAGLKTFGFRSKEKKGWSEEKIINRLKELADELGRSPVAADDPNLASAAKTHFGSWNAAKEKAGLETFSKGFPHNRESTKHCPGESKKIEMVKLSIRISNLTDPDEIESLARKLAQLKGVNVGEGPWNIHPSNLVDWAESEAHSVLKQYPGYYLRVQDGWAERTYNKIKGEGEFEPDTQSPRPDSTTEVKV